MKYVLLMAPFLFAAPAVSFGALSATATISQTGSTASVNHFAGSVTDTGTTTVGTFWYAWIPGQDYMTSSPTNITSPTVWVATITGGGAGDGFAIQWKASSAAFDIPAGSTLTGFGFDTTDSLASLQGNSSFFPTTPVGTSFVYSGTPFSDSGFRFVASTTGAVPEPASIGLLGLGAVAMLRRRRSV